MKITGGRYSKMNISAVSDKRTRYTPAIVREALFNMIDVTGMKMLELFAGSGIVSAEALSRSVEKTTLVEISRSSCITIRKNLEKFGDNFTILNLDFRIAIRRLMSKDIDFDFIFADPPFGTGLLFETFKEIDGHPKILRSDGIIVIESFEKEILPNEGKNIHLKSKKNYGDVILNFFVR
jgi:16S rRNA (guanine966-N2)-methyltransferase